jgi:THO complex subunit 7
LRHAEAIVDSRLNNDEKALRRVIKKYHAFTSAQPDAEEDAREAFLVELATFELALKKSLLVCQAETRQVEEYERERRKIGTSIRLFYIC